MIGLRVLATQVGVCCAGGSEGATETQSSSCESATAWFSKARRDRTGGEELDDQDSGGTLEQRGTYSSRDAANLSDYDGAPALIEAIPAGPTPAQPNEPHRAAAPPRSHSMKMA